MDYLASQQRAMDWTPSSEEISASNVGWLMRHADAASYMELHRWSVQHREEYWATAMKRLGIRLRHPFSRVMDLSGGVELPHWLPGARLNIVESCFAAPAESPAIHFQPEGGTMRTMSFGELKRLTDRVTAGILRLGCRSGDTLAIFMPMTAESVAIYLGIIQAGCAAVGIADSFRPKEIAVRLRLSQAVAVFTQDVLVRGGRTLPMYEHLRDAEAALTVVLPARETVSAPLRADDRAWSDFLTDASAPVEAVPRAPGDPINILFSSGTTGEPKAVPWTQTTPIKCAADAHFHQDVRPGDVLVWPTNLGWMMGPWLVFASLLNRAAMGLFYGAPTGREFCRFVQDARTTMLGVIPSLVKTWRAANGPAGLDWSTVRVFSSTGECSSADDMRWLMSQAGGRPVIEYCGGTEIGGGYITGTVARPAVAGTFNAPALGLDFVILDAEGQPADNGELFLVPPSIGLSNTLLNKDHHEVYYARTPPGPEGETLRRHGDQIERIADERWRGHGRADDTMNLGGIKVSSAEIERVLCAVPGVDETAAVAVAPGGGPSWLVIYAVCASRSETDRAELAEAMQNRIKADLNPLFKIHDLVLVEQLPRTASNKIMRRELRERYLALP